MRWLEGRLSSPSLHHSRPQAQVPARTCRALSHWAPVAQGFVYVLDCEGRSVEGWPLQMGEVQAQVGSHPAGALLSRLAMNCIAAW